MHGNLSGQDLKEAIVPILAAALRAVDPAAAVRAQLSLQGGRLQIGATVYDLSGIDRLVVVGAGKGGAPMAAAVSELLGPRISAGLLSVKFGHTAASGSWRVRFGSQSGPAPAPPAAVPGAIVLREAAHPVPDAAGQATTAEIAAILNDLTARDLALVLISGGGSALLPLPAAGLGLADLQALTRLLLECGADITEINTIRKHCSQVQGGQLARWAAPAQVATLILSDVVGSPLDAIASGPTVPDPTTFGDALAVLARYQILDQVPPAVRRHLERGVAGEVPETPKPSDPLFARVANLVIADNGIAARAAQAEARRQGWDSVLLSTYVQGEAREVGRAVAGLAQGAARGALDFHAPVCLILGGETTVTIRGRGRGGRNQELALAAAVALDDYAKALGRANVAVVSLATDGNDGPTDAAGGIALGDTVDRGRAAGLDARAALAANDSYPYLAVLGDLLFTGPTNTNVNDLIFVLCW